MLPPAVKLYGNADFLFQQDLALPTVTTIINLKLLLWLTHLTNPHRESMEYCQEEDEKNTDELKAAIKSTFNNTLAGFKGMQ